jgi:putative membrane protein
MKPFANALIVLVIVLHLGFLVLEMFLWQHPIGLRVFAQTPDAAASSAVLAMNQGLYNGFLAAGLIWGLLAGRRDVTLFFLACVLVAGVFGGLTAKPTILLVQALPALLAIGALLATPQRSAAAGPR